MKVEELVAVASGTLATFTSALAALLYCLWRAYTEPLGAVMQGPPNDRPRKPSDCTCSYPSGRAQNPTGHAQSCPQYARIMAEVEKDGAEYISGDLLPGYPPDTLASRKSPEATPDQFGPLDMGSDGTPFVEEDGPQPTNVKEDDSPRGAIRRTRMVGYNDRAVSGPIPGRPGERLAK